MNNTLIVVDDPKATKAFVIPLAEQLPT